MTDELEGTLAEEIRLSGYAGDRIQAYLARPGRALGDGRSGAWS